MSWPGILVAVPILYLIQTVSSAQPSPWNVQLVSKNFQHNLTWESGSIRTSVFYCCYSCRNSRWVPVDKCSNITNQSCDLTGYLTDIYEHYTMRVQSFNMSSEFVSLTPIEDTSLGPPLVSVIGCDKCIQVTINPPKSGIGKEHTVPMLSKEVYPVLIYTIMVVQPSKNPWQFTNLSKAVVNENYTYVINDLLPNTNYCISVSVSTSLNLKSPIPSDLQCATTYPQGGNVIVIVASIAVTLALIGLVLLLIALDRAGYLFLANHLIPKVLKPFPKSESMFYENTEVCYPACVVPVDVQHKTEEDDESGDEDCDRGYAQRRKLLDSDQSDLSGVDNSVPLTSEEPVSAESSGQDPGSSAEAGILKEVAPAQDAEERWPSRMAAAETNAIVNFSLSNEETFNVNLNSVLVGHPENLWPDFQKSHLKTDPEPLFTPHRPGECTGAHELGLSANARDAQTVAECEDFSTSDNETISYDGDDSDERFVSDYMRR